MSSHSPGPSRTARRAAAGILTIAALTAGTATAAQADDSADTTVGNVEVSGAISLSALTPSFTLVGLPGATVTGDADVSMNVATNNLAGYSVTVQAASDILAPANPGGGAGQNPDYIPVTALQVRPTGSGSFTALSNTSTVTTHTKGSRSVSGGDSLSDDYQVLIPFVSTDTYSVTLNYVATTL